VESFVERGMFKKEKPEEGLERKVFGGAGGAGGGGGGCWGV